MPDFTTDDVYDVVEKVREACGMNAKIDLLSHYGRTPLVRLVFNWALNPYIRFGVAKKTIPKPKIYGFLDPTSGVFPMDSDHWAMLDQLATNQLTGNAAIEAIEASYKPLTNKSAKLLYMILNKDLKTGVGVSTYNKAMYAIGQEKIPEFKIMLASKYDPVKLSKMEPPFYVEPKLDGYRVVAHVGPDGVRYLSRTGREFTTMSHIDDQLMDVFEARRNQLGWYKEWFVDGEVVNGSFNETSTAVRRQTANSDSKNLVFNIFDMLTAEEFKGKGKARFQSYEQRRKRIKHYMDACNMAAYPNVRLVDSYRVSSVAEAFYYYDIFRERGLEGAILKQPKHKYSFKRDIAWMKIKPKESVDLAITGLQEGTGKYEGALGAFVVDYNGVSVNVGTGIDDVTRFDLWRIDPDDIVGRVIEVEYMETTPDGSLRHPVFKCFRDHPSAIGEKE